MDDNASLCAEALIGLAGNLTSRQREMLSLLCEAPGNELSAGEIAHRMGLAHHAPINTEAANLAKRLTKAAGIEPPKRRDESSRWWPVLFTGRYSPEQRSRGFLWRLRPEFLDAAIECGLTDASSINLYPETSTDVLREGGKVSVLVNAYERNAAARKLCIHHYGCACSVCGVNLADRYGSVARGVIHVHHVIPLSHIGTRYEVDPIRDLRPVCPNCHVIIHRREPPFSIEEVQELMREQTKGRV